MISSLYISSNDNHKQLQQNFPIYSTPIKESFNSLNLNHYDNQITPFHQYDNPINYSNLIKNSERKTIVFNITKSKIESYSESSWTQYFHSGNEQHNTNNNIPLKEVKCTKNFNCTPTKKNLSYIFDMFTPKKKKNLFELSAASTNSITSKKKKKRYRKDKSQIEQLNRFYCIKNKKWTRSEIKEISKLIGIKETKVYKWLWDKKNKDEKKFKFYILK